MFENLAPRYLIFFAFPDLLGRITISFSRFFKYSCLIFVQMIKKVKSFIICCFQSKSIKYSTEKLNVQYVESKYSDKKTRNLLWIECLVWINESFPLTTKGISRVGTDQIKDLRPYLMTTLFFLYVFLPNDIETWGRGTKPKLHGLQCTQFIILLMACPLSDCFQHPHRLHLSSVLNPQCFRSDLVALLFHHPVLFFLHPANKKEMRICFA